MNKKGELTLAIGILIGIVIIGISTYTINEKLNNMNTKIEQKEAIYIGDTLSKIAYNINSNNPDCNINATISIDNKNFVSINNKEELEKYTIDTNCN